MPPFESVRGPRTPRSVFDLSHEVKTTLDMGLLVPVMAQEVYPGDTWMLGVEAVLRFMPLASPFLHQVDLFVHDWFVPNRIMWPSNGDPAVGWEAYITGGSAGTDAQTLPRWNPGAHGVGTLWDYFGLPIVAVGAGALPVDFPRRAYNMIYNAWYRDQNQVAEVALTNEAVLKRRWQKDYFTSALPWQQKGVSPALPVSGSAVWADGSITATSAPTARSMNVRGDGTNDNLLYGTDANGKLNMKGFLNSNTVNLTTFNVSDLRTAFQIQRWQERNARFGSRYVESVLAHFGIQVPDFRLQRPEYIGGQKFGVMVSEVIQTSETDSTAGHTGTPQGTMAGHGLVAGRGFCGKYRATEHGWIIRIVSVMPKPAYDSQGVNRQMLRESRYDFYWPEFAHLSEQPVTRAELYADNVEANNRTVFGYQARFEELRYVASKVTGLMRYNAAGTLSVWHMARYFAAPPALNQAFIECVPDKRILAVTTQPACLLNIGNIIKAVRPIPSDGEPGMIDHN